MLKRQSAEDELNKIPCMLIRYSGFQYKSRLLDATVDCKQWPDTDFRKVFDKFCTLGIVIWGKRKVLFYSFLGFSH
jgi:hypothetical protein